jgi:hypothetical protein
VTGPRATARGVAAHSAQCRHPRALPPRARCAPPGAATAW